MNEQGDEMMSKTPRVASMVVPLPLKAASAAIGLALASALPAAHAQEETVPLYLTMTQQFQHDNNLLREKNNKSSDTISTTQATVGLDKNYGRQHYTLDATIGKNKYKNFDQYDNDSYSASGSFTTEIASDFRLTLDGDAARSLPAFEDSTVNRQGRNIRKNQSYGADLRYGLGGRMSVNGGFRQSKADFALTESENKDSSATYVGLRYLPHELMYYGLTYTKTNTEFENRVFRYAVNPLQYVIQTGEEVESDNLSLSASWRVTGFSLFNGSIGYTRERNKYDTRRDFSGVTGSATWRYTPTEKTNFRLGWSRDTNNSGSFSFIGNRSEGFGVANGYVATNRVIDNFTAAVGYELTSKINLNSSYTFARYKEEARQVFELADTAQSRDGRYNSFALGGSYQPLRSLGVGCSATFYDRTQSQFQQAYDGRTVSCYAAFTLQ